MDATLPTSAARSAFGLVTAFVIVFAAAAFGAQFMPGAWYESLNKPPLNPPNWIFGPVWTVLYGMMAVAAWRVWRKAGLRGSRSALVLFGLQLVINAAWSALFFGAQQPLWALIDIGALWLAIVSTIWAFGRIDRVAAGLLLPYLAWVTFAGYLNAMLWWLNR